MLITNFEVAPFELHNGNGLETLSLCAGKWDQFVG